MNFIQSITLGIVQGLTEFLPISSSFHLVLVPYIMEWKYPPVSFSVFLHFGTLISILSYYRSQLKMFLNIRFLILVFFATLPAGFFGIVFKNHIEKIFESPLHSSIFLIITGIILWIGDKLKGNKKIETMSIKQSFLIGIAQAFALFPGISRSGSTIICAMLLGFNREESAKFSFLIAIPAILGATGLKIFDAIRPCENLPVLIHLTGIITSSVFGFIAIATLLKILKEKSLKIFSCYCFLVGGISIVLYFK